MHLPYTSDTNLKKVKRKEAPQMRELDEKNAKMRSEAQSKMDAARRRVGVAGNTYMLHDLRGAWCMEHGRTLICNVRIIAASAIKVQQKVAGASRLCMFVCLCV